MLRYYVAFHEIVLIARASVKINSYPIDTQIKFWFKHINYKWEVVCLISNDRVVDVVNLLFLFVYKHTDQKIGQYHIRKRIARTVWRRHEFDQSASLIRNCS